MNRHPERRKRRELWSGFSWDKKTEAAASLYTMAAVLSQPDRTTTTTRARIGTKGFSLLFWSWKELSDACQESLLAPEVTFYRLFP